MPSILFSHLNGVIGRALKGELAEADLTLQAPTAEASLAHSQFIANWNEELRTPQPSLLRALRKTFLRELLIAAVFKLVWGALIVLSASYFVRALLTFLQKFSVDPSIGKAEGWILACFFFLCCFLLSLALQQMAAVSSTLGLRVRAALACAVYRKSLVVDRNAAAMDVVGLVSTDCTKMLDACTTLNYLWSGVVEALAIIAVLLGLIGRAALPGLGLLLLLIPFQYFMGTLASRTRKSVVEASDSRVRLMDEILRAAKLVKAYGWEESFARMVSKFRNKETSLQAAGGYIKSANLMTVFALPPLIAISIFGVYIIDHRLDGVTAFTTLSLFNTLRLPLVVLPKCLRSVAEAIASASRLQQYLTAPETRASVRAEKTQIVFREASFTFGTVSPPLLRGLNLEAYPGQLVMVAGPVGSGKSNFCQAILGQMTLVSGDASVGAKFAYVPQSPWCQFGTVRDNILFGLPYDEHKYRHVLHACALLADLDIMEDGDMTEIGERGVNISGGQKQRIALARAAYSGANTFILDSPLSAVDQYTCQHIFKHCIRGIMRGCTVVLVTHQIELFPYADKLVVLSKGEFSYCGPFDPDVVRKHFGLTVSALPDTDVQMERAAQEDVAQMVRRATSFRHSIQAASVAELVSGTPRRGDGADGAEMDMGLARKSVPSLTTPVMARQRSNTGIVPDSRMAGDLKDTSAIVRAMSKRVSVMHQVEGGAEPSSLPRRHTLLGSMAPTAGHDDGHAVAPAAPPAPAFRPARPPRKDPTVGNPYWILIRNITLFGTLFSVTMFTGAQLCRIYSDIWISSWVGGTRDQGYYIFIYGMYILVFMALLLVRGNVFYILLRRTARIMHAEMFEKILRAPLHFFTVTPIGRVLSVFAKDVDQIDEALQDNIHMFVIYLHILGTTIGVVIRVLPFFAIVAGVLLLSFMFFFRYYIAASRVFKAATGTSLSLLTAHVSETQQGLSVIHAYEAQNRFIIENVARLNRAQIAGSNLEQLQVWLAFRLDTIGCLLVLGTCLIGVGIDSGITPALAGLAISNAFQILLFFSLMIRAAADIDANIASVERMTQLAQVQAEPDKPLDHESCPKENWPQFGQVEFHNVVMSYAPELPHVLKGVTFALHRAEKIGVVGRTGAGKSSLVMALFRLAEPSEGSIRIDGVDTKALNLRELRRRISIIPQEPVMFEGTVRSNLDPFKDHSDEELMDALDKCHLRAYIEAEPKKLDMDVSHNGSNFSLGQMQLFCLARALLNPSKLLVLDEATAALDLETDALVQRTIRTQFLDRTIICIAHRLDTIIDSDRILVMSEGRVAEFDTPYALLQDETSIFSKLCKQTGSQYELLREAAEQHQRTMLALATEVELEMAAEEEEMLEALTERSNMEGDSHEVVDAVHVGVAVREPPGPPARSRVSTLAALPNPPLPTVQETVSPVSGAEQEAGATPGHDEE